MTSTPVCEETQSLIGADGGRSTMRKRLDIAFERYPFPERFLVVTFCGRAWMQFPQFFRIIWKEKGSNAKPSTPTLDSQN
jgi:2-polyprenyl-6-methoxyphenol hydroxylase-like FAD-dependent oxidoreductase